jgi:general secretion pathway protein K
MMCSINLQNFRKSTVQRAHGFVLAVVLWLLAGLSLVAALMGESALLVAQRVAQLRERVAFTQSAQTTQAQVQIWLASSIPRALDYSNGVANVLVNSVFYRLESGSTVAIQDEAGLIQLNTPDRQQLAKLLVLCGVEVPKLDSMLDALEDYIDDDNLSRVNGAEQDIYTQAGQQAPRNGQLLSVAEVWQVWGWAAEKKRMTELGCEKMLSITGQAGLFGAAALNVTTAPPLVLRAAGVDDATVAELIKSRGNPEQVMARSLLLNEQFGGKGIFGAAIAGQASRYLNVTHVNDANSLSLNYLMEILPPNSQKPWYVRAPLVAGQANAGADRWQVGVPDAITEPAVAGIPASSTPSTSATILPWPKAMPSPTQRNAKNNVPF